MWPDNETTRDFLNFTGVADTIAEIIVQANGRPISIGVSGAWGIGKSSLIGLTRAGLEARPPEKGQREFVFVEFNAWLYQGYDDARAALMDVIAAKLADEAETRATALDKTKELLKRVKWFRVTKTAAIAAASVAAGVPPIGLIGEVIALARQVTSGVADSQTIEAGKNVLEKVAGGAGGWLDAKEESSPPKEIQALRDSFEEALEELGITLIVLIDDLDRCLPPTTISTLEAVRLFLFLDNTAFVIAADTEMIKHAVRHHFAGLDDEALVTNYFDKLIQVPIRVPPLGTQEVRAYMMLLYVENSSLDDSTKEAIRKGVCDQLRQSWQGKRVDRAFVTSLASIPGPLIAKLDAADRLAPLMTSASGIAGNPRLVKRFLNALALRMSISNAQGVGVDEAVLAKLLLFERLATPKAYADLMASVAADDKGRPSILAELETQADAGKEVKFPPEWEKPFMLEWLRLAPKLAGQDLRGALYVSREHAPLISAADRLSSEAAELLTALLEHPEVAQNLKARLSALPKTETAVIMDRLLERARQEQEWGAPPILNACLVVATVDPPQGQRIAGFLQERPVAQIKANLIPKIADQPWSATLFTIWDKNSGVAGPVKNAIRSATK